MHRFETILLADGDLNSRQLLTTKLSSYGYRVVAVSDGEEALFSFAKEKPQLIVLDVMLPKIDGYQVCNKLREISQTPIVLLAALGNVTDRIIGFNLGANDYVISLEIEAFATAEQVPAHIIGDVVSEVCAPR